MICTLPVIFFGWPRCQRGVAINTQYFLKRAFHLNLENVLKTLHTKFRKLQLYHTGIEMKYSRQEKKINLHILKYCLKKVWLGWIGFICRLSKVVYGWIAIFDASMHRKCKSLVSIQKTCQGWEKKTKTNQELWIVKCEKNQTIIQGISCLLAFWVWGKVKDLTDFPFIYLLYCSCF